MRLRNIPRAEGVLEACKEVVKNPAGQKSRWHELFQNQNPVHIEIGMGKGQFLLTLAERNPDINYIGIERYSSVLLRAVEKFQLLSESPKGAPSNIRFLCMDARDLPEVFAPGEIEKIYLNFFRSLAKSQTCKKAPHFPGVSQSLCQSTATPAERWNSRQTTVPSLTSPKKRYRNPPSSLWTA